MKQDEYSTARPGAALEQQKSNSWTPVGPTKDKASSSSQFNWKLYAGDIIKSEVRLAGMQLKRAVKSFYLLLG